ncbi:sulfatase-like hydrolase/transferase [Falsihalocynthiibacter sp. SS001]|uniref:sulfatase-like hydrolase/transferase n=1 Tax=Falsihalocynthiibacter sp. SS001 TaxID=3349698 RepID=UPI0036D29DAD
MNNFRCSAVLGLIFALAIPGALSAQVAEKPNIVYFLVDNLGFGELGSYGGGILRGAETPELDALAEEGLRLLNFAPETQCTPSRSALMTGRYSIRSGNHSVALAGSTSGLVDWERTLAEVLADEGYATAIVGKWHIGASEGRWPTDQGFEEWIGPAHSYDEAFWVEDPWYDPERDPVSYVYESKQGEQPTQWAQLTVPLKLELDVEYLKRSQSFIDRSLEEEKPFFLYFNHTMMHMPTRPRPEFKGRTGHGDWADSLAQLDADFASLKAMLEERGILDNTILIFSGDNGSEEMEPDRGHSGFFEGSYFTGMEGSLRTPAMIRYPGKVPAGRISNEIVHITDMFTTIALWAGAEVPQDREIDGLDQREFFEGKTDLSAREGFPYWMGEVMYGVKWRNFKVVSVLQRTFTDPALRLATPHIINLEVDPGERKPYNFPYIHSWVAAHAGRIVADFKQSTLREELIPLGAPVDFIPGPSE